MFLCSKLINFLKRSTIFVSKSQESWESRRFWSFHEFSLHLFTYWKFKFCKNFTKICEFSILDKTCLKNEWILEDKFAKMRKCITKFTCMLSSERPCAPSFLYLPRPRCIAAVWWFLLRGCVLSPEDAFQKRFSWFFYWIPKVQTCVNLVDLVKSFQTSI